METTVLVALFLASVLFASLSSESIQCKNVSEADWVAVRDDTSIPLSCTWNDSGIRTLIDVPIQWYYNSTALITDNARIDDGINFTLESTGNSPLEISLPQDYSRIKAERNYTCGCTEDGNEKWPRGVQVLIVEPLQDPSKPRVLTAEIGKQYDLHSPFVFGLNRRMLTVSWRKGSLTDLNVIVNSDKSFHTAGYTISDSLSLHIANVTATDGAYYVLQVAYTSQNTLEFQSKSDLIRLIPFTKPVIQPVFPSVTKLVLYNGKLKGGMTSLQYSHNAGPLGLGYVNMAWQVNTTAIRSSTGRTSTFSFVQPELDEELDGLLTVVRATFCVSLNISESGQTLTYHEDSVTVFFHILKISQSQHFHVVLERLSFQVLQARITYPQALPTGFDFEVVFFNAGNKIHTVTGATGVSEQVVLISLDNVDTLSSVTARMEFVYSEDRFEGPEVTASIPPYCPQCIIGAVCGTVLLVVGCVVMLTVALVVRKYRKRKHRRSTFVTPDYGGNASGTSHHHSRRGSSTSDYPQSVCSGNCVDQGNSIHPPCMVVVHLPRNVSTGTMTGPPAHTRVCNSVQPEECRESSVDRRPPMRQRSYSEGQLADSLQIQRLEESRPDAHHYDIPRRTSRVNNEWIGEVPRGIQHTSELDSISTGVQSTRPLINTHINSTGFEGGDVVDTMEN